jgi:hypothetical protein
MSEKQLTAKPFIHLAAKLGVKNDEIPRFTHKLRGKQQKIGKNIANFC